MAAPHSIPRRARRATSALVPTFFLYGEPLQAPDERLVHIETIAARSRLHDWNIQPHRHRDLHQVLFMQRGHLVARVDDATESLEAPAIVVVPPSVVHAFSFQPGAVGLVVSFAPGFVRDFAAVGGTLAAFLDRPAVTTVDGPSMRATDLVSLADMLLREFGRSAPGRHAALRGLLAALLANVLRLAYAPYEKGSTNRGQLSETLGTRGLCGAATCFGAATAAGVSQCRRSIPHQTRALACTGRGRAPTALHDDVHYADRLSLGL